MQQAILLLPRPLLRVVWFTTIHCRSKSNKDTRRYVSKGTGRATNQMNAIQNKCKHFQLMWSVVCSSVRLSCFYDVYSMAEFLTKEQQHSTLEQSWWQVGVIKNTIICRFFLFQIHQRASSIIQAELTLYPPFAKYTIVRTNIQTRIQSNIQLFSN